MNKTNIWRKFGAELIKRGEDILISTFKIKFTKITYQNLNGIVDKKLKLHFPLRDNVHYLTDFKTWAELIEYDWTNKRDYLVDKRDCLLPETPLVIKQNEEVKIKQIQELPKEPSNTYVLDKDNTWTKINWVKSKKSDKPISIVRGKGGFLETTNDHKFYNEEDFTEISKLGETPELEMVDSFEFLGENEFDTELAYAFGVFFTEGTSKTYQTKTTKNGHSWHIDMADLDCLERIKPTLEKYTGVKLKIILYPSQTKGSIRGGITSKKDIHRLKTNGTYGDVKKLVDIFRDKFYTNSFDKKVPNEILHASKEAKREFINGWIAGDGHKINEYRTELSVRSRIACSGLQMIVKQCGMPITIGYDKRTYGKKRTCAVMTISNREEPSKNGVEAKNHINEEDRGENIVYDINTESGHFFTGGYLVHNCDDYAEKFSANMSWLFGLNSAFPISVELLDPKSGNHIGYHRAVLIVTDNKKLYMYDPMEGMKDGITLIKDKDDIIIKNWRYKPRIIRN